MKIKEFKTVPPEDFPKLPKDLWEVLGPIQSQIKDLTNLVNGKIGLDNQNVEFLEGKMVSAVESIFTLTKIGGAPKGGVVLMVNSTSQVSMFRIRTITEKKIGLYFTLDPASTEEVVARFLIVGA
jgi:hypothetical protein